MPRIPKERRTPHHEDNARFLHDLRSCLQSVLGYCELLEAEVAGPLNRKQKQYVDHIKAGAEKIQHVIEPK